MPRDIDNIIAQRLYENHRIMVMVRIDFETPIYVHSRFGEVLFEGNTYYGVGAFGSISSRTEDTAVNPQRLTLSLSGIPLRFVDLVLSSTNYQNRDVYIYKALLDTDETILGGVVQKWFRGVTGNASIQEQPGQNISVEMEVSNFLAKWRRPANLRYNDETQQQLYPGDTSLTNIIDAQAGKVWRGV